jgi:hypothetical protein
MGGIYWESSIHWIFKWCSCIAAHATAEELDEMLKVYRYDGLAAGIRCDAITGKNIVMNGNFTCINSKLYNVFKYY